MDRRIRTIKRDAKGNVIALCNSEEAWSPVSKDAVMRDIKCARRSYYVQELAKKVYIRAAPGNKLQTTLDETSKNHLDKLPSV